MKMLEQYNYLYLHFFLLFSVTIFLYKWLRFRNLVSKNLPPSPPKLPIIGNLHQLSKNLHISLGSLAQKYGPLMLLKFGSVPVLVVSTADAAQEILKSHDLVFSDRPDSSISNRILYNGKDVALARYSEYWRQVKSVCVTQLLSKKRVSSFHNVREEEVALLIQTIENSHSTVNLSELFSELTSSVVCRVALGKKYEIGGGVSHKKLLGEMTELLGFFRSIGKYIPLLSWVDWLEGLKGKVEKIANEIDSFLEGVVIDHQNAIASDNSYANKDFISILLEIQKDKIDSDFLLIDKECIKAVILDMFFAGTETASTTLEWTIAAVLKNPNVMLKLQNEVREICKGKPKVLEADLVEMHYLKAVIKESMRMYIAAPLLLPRAAREDVKVMGYDIKAGTQVLVNAWAIARDPSLWDKAEEFRPERFLNSPIDYKGQHYEYLPFGAGRRACPGIRFAMNLMELAIANLVHKFDFELPDGGRMEDLDMTSESGITVRKKSPLLVIATPNV